MNGSMVRVTLGQVLKLEGAFMFLPVLISVIYQEKVGLIYLGVAISCLLVGFLMTLSKPKESTLYLREGCEITGASWIVLSLFGAIPFTLTGEIPFYLDAVFEVVSGFTTTGATILTDVEALSHTSLMWRSFTHWLGGMGVLVFLMAIVPLSGGSNINLMRAESPGPSVGKLVPKIKSTARILYIIYFCLTMIEFGLLLCGGMKAFDALAMSFGTAGTGGFGVLNDSAASYSPYIQWVITVFMLLFGVNFNAYYFIILGKIKGFFMEEVTWYLGIVAGAIAIITANIYSLYSGFWEAVRQASFQVGSIVTTTGFATADFNLWPQLSKAVLIILMLVGACAGSTGGGIKVSRIVIAFKTIGKEIDTYIHPKSVKRILFEKKPVEHETLRSINVYLITYTLIFIVSFLIVSLENYDFTTTITSILATFNNIGPGLELVGPTGNFAFFNPLSKIVLMVDMLAGRLEIFPLIVMVHPKVWKEMFISGRVKKKISSEIK